jgi:MerR family transcriptional regulator, copper efflux regulator
MHIKELTARTGTPERQIRFLISEGFMPPPQGGRANADYSDDHVEAIERYKRLRDLGFPPAAIKLLLQAREGVPFPVEPGVTLVIDPELVGKGRPVGPLVDKVRSLLTDIFKEPSHARDRITDSD